MISLVVKRLDVIEEFEKDFARAYEKHFAGKSYLLKNGNEYSVIVSFAKNYFPNQNRYGAPYLVIELDTDMLYAYFKQEKDKTELTDKQGGYLVKRYLAQEGKKDKDIREKVEAEISKFIEDVCSL
ncbi:MAG: hypothetical protein QXX30_00845 [Candidatus Aenigmatarchaeota archaeon]